MIQGGNLRYEPKSLGDAPSAEVSRLVEPCRQRRLVLYLGAGVSIPSPACGPRGNHVADLLRPVVSELLGVAEADLTEPDLETLAARVARDAPDRLAELRERAADIW